MRPLQRLTLIALIVICTPAAAPAQSAHLMSALGKIGPRWSREPKTAARCVNGRLVSAKEAALYHHSTAGSLARFNQ